MPSFNPSTVLLDIDDEPMKDGKINDPVARGRINAIRVRLADADEKHQPAIQEELRIAVEEAQPTLTVGSAMVGVLINPLPDADDRTRQKEETLSGEEKADLTEMAIKIKRAMRENASVTFGNKDIDIIKKRVARGYSSPLVVGRVFAAIRDEPAS